MKKNNVGKIVLITFAIIAMVGSMFTYLVAALINL